MKTNPNKSGFTLVELAIVLVIIGLIVGGVLVGQDMIKAAELRAAVGQVEKIDTAVNVFRNKYNGIPGDIANPANFGFTAPSGAVAKQGNGVLDSTATGQVNEEPALFFNHLSTANLIQESINVTTGDVTAGGVLTSSKYFPASKLGKGLFILANSAGGVNYYMIDAMTLTNAGVVAYPHTALSPIIAANFDVKLDDGNPTTGKVQAVDDLTTAATATAAAVATSGKCVDSAKVAYQTSTQPIADAAACTLRIRASF